MIDMSKKRDMYIEKRSSSDKWEIHKEELLKIQSVQNEYQKHLEELKKLKKKKNKAVIRIAGHTVATLATGVFLLKNVNVFSKEKVQTQINFTMEEENIVEQSRENNLIYNCTDWYKVDYEPLCFRVAVVEPLNQIWIDLGKNNGNTVEILKQVPIESLEEELEKIKKSDKKSRAFQMGALSLITALVAFTENTLDSPKDYNDSIQEEQKHLSRIKKICNDLTK